MKAMVWHGVGDIQLQEVEDPRVEAPTDAVVRLTTTAVYGTSLSLVRGGFLGLRPGTILGHEGVGIVEALGEHVRNLAEGDRVVIPSTIACGGCHPCRNGWTAQCDYMKHDGLRGASHSGDELAVSRLGAGLQAEKARVPFASFNLVKLPDGVSDGQAILISDVFPTGFAGAEMARIREGNSVAVLGCGPVGLFAIASARLMGAGRILAVDSVTERLGQARRLGAETIDSAIEDPVDVLMQLTGGVGVDRTIEAMGFGPGPALEMTTLVNGGVSENGDHGLGSMTGSGAGPSSTPSLRWAVEMLAKQGVASIIGAIPEYVEGFPIGLVYDRNLTVRGGTVHHRMLIPRLIDLVVSGRINPLEIVSPSVETRLDRLEDVYRRLDHGELGWTKVALISR